LYDIAYSRSAGQPDADDAPGGDVVGSRAAHRVGKANDQALDQRACGFSTGEFAGEPSRVGGQVRCGLLSREKAGDVRDSYGNILPIGGPQHLPEPHLGRDVLRLVLPLQPVLHLPQGEQRTVGAPASGRGEVVVTPTPVGDRRPRHTGKARDLGTGYEPLLHCCVSFTHIVERTRASIMAPINSALTSYTRSVSRATAAGATGLSYEGVASRERGGRRSPRTRTGGVQHAVWRFMAQTE
jgi:hypothetical protein